MKVEQVLEYCGRWPSSTLTAIDPDGTVRTGDIGLSRNPIFNTANMKLNRPLVARYFLGPTDGDAGGD